MTLGSLLSRGVVQLRLWQEVERGVVDRRLEGKVLHSSSLSVQVPQVRGLGMGVGRYWL